MGITGLLNFIKDNQSSSAIEPGHISQFRGKRAAIDVYSWLHKSIYTCATELFMNKPTTKYIDYCMKYINLLKSFEIRPVLVFDGDRMPFKIVEAKRRDERSKAKQQAKDMLAVGRTSDAHKFMVQAIDITHEMAVNLIKAARNVGVDCLVAPYEADSQLAYLEIKGHVDFIITEDSDLIVFGCTKIFFKLNINGDGEIYSKAKLAGALQKRGFKKDFDFEKFRHAAILSGCDYCKNLPGIGLVKACKFITMTENRDIRQFLKKIPSYLNIPVQVDETYIKSFIMADMSFKYSLVFDPVSKMQVPFSEVQEKSNEYFEFINSFNIHDVNALELALGNIDIKNVKYDDFKINNSSHSIYSQENKSQESPSNKSAIVKQLLFKKIIKKKTAMETCPLISEKSDSELMEYYASLPEPAPPVVKPKVKEEVRKRPRSCKFSKNAEGISESEFFPKEGKLDILNVEVPELLQFQREELAVLPGEVPAVPELFQFQKEELAVLPGEVPGNKKLENNDGAEVFIYYMHPSQVLLDYEDKEIDSNIEINEKENTSTDNSQNKDCIPSERLGVLTDADLRVNKSKKRQCYYNKSTPKKQKKMCQLTLDGFFKR